MGRYTLVLLGDPSEQYRFFLRLILLLALVKCSFGATSILIMESPYVQLLSMETGNRCEVVDGYQIRRYREKGNSITWVCVKEKKDAREE